MSSRDTRAAAMRAHARDRALERYGLSYNRSLLDDIRRAIRSGHNQVIQRVSLRVSLRMVTVRGQRLPIVWDSKRREVVTFLPPDAREIAQIIADTEAAP